MSSSKGNESEYIEISIKSRIKQLAKIGQIKLNYAISKVVRKSCVRTLIKLEKRRGRTLQRKCSNSL